MKTKIAYCLTLLTLPGCQSAVELPEPPAPDLSSAYEEVRSFIEQKRSALLGDQGAAQLWGQYGMALDAHEFHEEALACYRIAAELDPGESRWAYLAAVRLQKDSASEAVHYLQKAADGRSETLPMQLLRYDLLHAEADASAAETVIATAAQEAPDHPAILYRIARQAFESGSVDRAVEVLEEIDQDYRETSRLRRQMKVGGVAVEIPDEDSDALLPIAATVADPDLEAVSNYRRDPLWRGKDAAERARSGDRLGMMTLESLVRKHPELVENRLQLALIIFTNGGAEQAHQILDAGLHLAPKDTRLLAGKATLATMSGDWDTAEQFLRDVLTLDPSHVAAWADLGFVLEQQNDIVEAVAAYERALSLNPGDKELEVRIQHLQRQLQKRSP